MSVFSYFPKLSSKCFCFSIILFHVLYFRRIYFAGLNQHRRKYLADLYVTLLDLEWRYAMAILFNTFLVTFLVFAVFWWLMAYNNGDFDNLENPKHDFCLLGVRSFPGAILFSMETQTTIGYGMAYPNAKCAGTLPIMYLQVITSSLVTWRPCTPLVIEELLFVWQRLNINSRQFNLRNL